MLWDKALVILRTNNICEQNNGFDSLENLYISKFIYIYFIYYINIILYVLYVFENQIQKLRLNLIQLASNSHIKFRSFFIKSRKKTNQNVFQYVI